MKKGGAGRGGKKGIFLTLRDTSTFFYIVIEYFDFACILHKL